MKFKQGDLIEGKDQNRKYRARIIAVENNQYKIYWIGGSEEQQLRWFLAEVIEEFYERVE